MNKKKIVILIIIAVAAISIGLYTILPLFTNTVVEEPLPAASGFSPSGLAISKFTVIFEKSGTYPYLCNVHPWMTGSVIVK